VRALAAVVGQTGEERRRVDVVVVGLEADGVPVERGVASLDELVVDHHGRREPVGTGHGVLLQDCELVTS
jgi:hypothetical protein